jgi:hypothetical protein
MFILKVKEKGDYLVSDNASHLGGIDLTQEYAFYHLFPSGACHWGFRELLYELAHIHGWKVQVKKEGA